MLCCCGLFRLFLDDEKNVCIEYRPFKYRRRLEEERNEAVSTIQRAYRESSTRKNKTELQHAIKEMEFAVSKVPPISN